MRHYILILFAITVLTSALTVSVDIEDQDDDSDSFSIEDTADKNYYDSYDEDDWQFIKKEDKTIKPTVSEHAIFLPHEKYCQYFYVFDGRDSHLYRCASGYRFDVEKLQCMKKKNVNCGKRKKNVDSSEEDDIRITFKCGKWRGIYTHDYYCHLYYVCASKKASLIMCPPGMLFNADSGKCDFRHNVDCGKKVDPYDNEDTETVAQPDSDEATYNCPQSSGFYLHPLFCNKFIRCWYGYGDVYVCPRDTLYDVDLMKCRTKSSVYCQDRLDPYDFGDEEPAELVDSHPDFECKVLKGRFPHDTDCQKFYQCILGEASLWTCPQSRLYDTKTQSCRKHSEVICHRNITDEDIDEEFICPVRDGIFKDEENCGSFYRCKNGKAHHVYCPEGELFDSDWKSCVDEDDVTCGDRLLPGDDPDEESTIIDENPKYKCQKPHGRFTHEEICNWFYHCKDGKSSIRTCTKDKMYDSERSFCFHEVNCGQRKPKEVLKPTKPPGFVCPSKSGKFPHEKNCDEFYTCEKGKHKRHHCPKGKLFHEKLRSCEKEETVMCGNRLHPDMDPNKPQDDVIDPHPPFECPVNHGRIEHKDYCDWYYSCHDKKAILRQCRKGNYFDIKKKKCEHSHRVSCNGRREPEDREFRSTTEVSITTTPKEFQCRKPEGKFAHEKDCGKFYFCKKWKYTVQKCPRDKLFDDKRHSCEDEHTVKCGDRIHPNMDPDAPQDEIVDPNPEFRCKLMHSRYPHYEYCDWYYHCHDKKPVVRQCRAGRYFDSKKKKCMLSKDVSCNGRKTPDDRTKVSPTVTVTKTTTTEEFGTTSRKTGSTGTEMPTNFTTIIEAKTSTPFSTSSLNNVTTVSNTEETKSSFLTSVRTAAPSDSTPASVSSTPSQQRSTTVSSATESTDYLVSTSLPSNSTETSSVSTETSTSTSSSSDVTSTQNPLDITSPESLSTTVNDIVSETDMQSTSSSITTESTTEMSTSQIITTSTFFPTSNVTKPRISTTEARDETPSRTATTYIQSTLEDNTTTESFSPTSVTITKNPSTIITKTTQKSTFVPEITTMINNVTSESSSPTSVVKTTQSPPTKITKEASQSSTEVVTKTTPEVEITTNPQYPSTSSDFYSTHSQPTSILDETTTQNLSSLSTSTSVVTTMTSPTTEDANFDEIVDPNPNYSCRESNGNFEHDKYCHYYYHCEDNKATLRQCPEGQNFDVIREKCLEWYMVICGSRLTPEEINSTGDYHRKTTQILKTSSFIHPNYRSTIEPAIDFVCPRTWFSKTSLHPHEKNCAKYYFCENKVPKLVTCPQGQLYNVNTKECDDEQDTDCGDRLHPDEDPDSPVKVIDDKPNYKCTQRHGSFKHEIFCNWYYRCRDNKPELRECPKDQYFDAVRSKCLDWYIFLCRGRMVFEETTPQ